jgi:hypothetical protein
MLDLYKIPQRNPVIVTQPPGLSASFVFTWLEFWRAHHLSLNSWRYGIETRGLPETSKSSRWHPAPNIARQMQSVKHTLINSLGSHSVYSTIFTFPATFPDGCSVTVLDRKSQLTHGLTPVTRMGSHYFKHSYHLSR